MAGSLGGVPDALDQHAAVYVPPLNAIVVIGGKAKSADATARLFAFNVTSATWYLIPNGNERRRTVVRPSPLCSVADSERAGLNRVCVNTAAVGAPPIAGFMSHTAVYDALFDRYDNRPDVHVRACSDWLTTDIYLLAPFGSRHACLPSPTLTPLASPTLTTLPSTDSIIVAGGFETGWYNSNFARPVMTISPYTGVWSALSTTNTGTNEIMYARSMPRPPAPLELQAWAACCPIHPPRPTRPTS